MRSCKIFVLVLNALFFIAGCHHKNKKEEKFTISVLPTSDSLLNVENNIRSNDSAVTIEKKYFPDSLGAVRQNYQRINAIPRWTKVRTEDLTGSIEGGDAKFYYQGNVLEKIMTHYFGETFQSLTEYYLLNGQLSFVYEMEERYNRPFYYDSVAMKESGDTEAFDRKRSLIHTTRSYFDKGKLLQQLISNQKAGKNVDDNITLKDPAKEEQRLLKEFKKMLELIAGK